MDGVSRLFVYCICAAKADRKFYGKAAFLLELVVFTKTVSSMIAFRNSYLVKSVNLAFMHLLFRSVYHDVVFVLYFLVIFRFCAVR